MLVPFADCMDTIFTTINLSKFQIALADIHQHSLESEITLIKEVHPPPPSSNTMSIYMMSSSTDPLVSIIIVSPSDLSLH